MKINVEMSVSNLISDAGILFNMTPPISIDRNGLQISCLVLDSPMLIGK